jgi:polysaccharide chain length determinant protein (PEP-CTERM system associated)
VDDYQGESGAGLLVQYAEAPFRRPLAVVIPLVIALGVSLALAKYLPRRYRASALILVEGENVPQDFAKKLGAETGKSQLQTLRQEMLSRERLEGVLTSLYPDVKEGPRLNSLIEHMRASIFVSSRGKDSFSIEYEEPSPRRAMEMANLLAKVFVEDAGQTRAHLKEGTQEFIEAQLEDARKALEGQEESVRAFKERNMGRLPEQTGANLATLQRLQSEKQGVEASLRGAQARVEEIEKNGPPEPGLGGELTKLYEQLAELRLRYTDEYPDVQKLKLKIERLQQERVDAGGASAEQRAESGLENARLQVEKLQTKSDQLDQKIAEVQSRVDEVPRLEQELTTLNRDASKLKENYQAMLSRKMQSDLGQKLEEHWKGQHFQILDPAVLPTTPVFPNRPLFILIGILAGLGVGVVISLGLELIDPSIKSVRELEGVVPFPVLATLPRVAPPKRAAKPARRLRSA